MFISNINNNDMFLNNKIYVTGEKYVNVNTSVLVLFVSDKSFFRSRFNSFPIFELCAKD